MDNTITPEVFMMAAGGPAVLLVLVMFTLWIIGGVAGIIARWRERHARRDKRYPQRWVRP